LKIDAGSIGPPNLFILKFLKIICISNTQLDQMI
jgi:hypothetical protein